MVNKKYIFLLRHGYKGHKWNWPTENHLPIVSQRKCLVIQGLSNAYHSKN